MALSLSRTRRRVSSSRMYSELDRSSLAVRVGLSGDEKAPQSARPAESSKKLSAAASSPAESFEGFGSFS